MVVPFLLVVWPFLIPVAAAVYMFSLAWTRGGDPEEDSATVQYGPPENKGVPCAWVACERARFVDLPYSKN
jgi:hypothetical protein